MRRNTLKHKKKTPLTKKNNAEKINSNKIRLNKFISNSGICSRREADKFIKAGIITVNGMGVTEMGYKINTNDVVKFNNQEIKSESLRYVVLNKPKNYSGRIESGTQTVSVMSLISNACKEKIYPTDKLNKSETGILIFTNDTSLAKKIGNKNHPIKSIYQISLNKKLSQVDFEKIKEGLFINGKKTTFDSISYIKNKQKNEIGIEHRIGGIKYIKEVFKKLNYSITKLDRVFFCGLTKKNLPRKYYRHLSPNEINILKRL